MNHAQTIIANAMAFRGMNTGVTVDLYADDLCAENRPAEFTESGEWVSDDAVNNGKEFWEITCELDWVLVGNWKMNRGEVVKLVGEDSVANLEAHQAVVLGEAA